MEAAAKHDFVATATDELSFHKDAKLKVRTLSPPIFRSMHCSSPIFFYVALARKHVFVTTYKGIKSAYQEVIRSETLPDNHLCFIQKGEYPRSPSCIFASHSAIVSVNSVVYQLPHWYAI